MYSTRHVIKKFIAFFPYQLQKHIYNYYQYFRFFPRLCLLRIQLRILPAITSNRMERRNLDENFDQRSSRKYIHKRTLVFEDLKSAQFLIDSLSYPSTHQYNLDGLETLGTLRNRRAVLKEIAPNFFHGENFLDIGCNKGFFSLLAAESFDRVQCIDTDEKFIKLCRFLKQPNMDVFHTSFRDFIPQLEFDKVFIGNVHHYIFKECRGWEWIYKLAAISTNKVLIEGPVDMNCKDMVSVIPKDLELKFTFEKFMQVMGIFFTLEQKVLSVSPGRWVMLFKRKPDKFNNRIKLNNLPIIKLLKEDKYSIIFITNTKGQRVIAKIHKNPICDLRMKINIARLSPISNGSIGSIYKDKTFVGWLEKYEESNLYKYKENQVELFKLICKHTIFLAKLGYFDSDCATINFFKRNNKMFDKGFIIPIKMIKEDVYNNYTNRCKRGYYFIQLNQSYDIISKDMQEDIYKAIKSIDPYIIETTFSKIRSQL